MSDRARDTANAATASLIERAEWQKHRWPADASDLITELVDELQAALRVVDASLAIDSHSQGFPPMIPPSLIAPFRESLEPFRG